MNDMYIILNLDNHLEEAKVIVPFTKLNPEKRTLREIFISEIISLISRISPVTGFYLYRLLVAVDIAIGTYRVSFFRCILQNVFVVCYYFILFDDKMPFLLIYLQNSW